MTEPVPPSRFHEIGWRVVRTAASASFHTGSFATGLALVDRIGELAAAVDLHPDLDLRTDSVTVRLLTRNPEHFIWLTEGDLELAERISAAARELGVDLEPLALQRTQVMIDALVIPDLVPFWLAVLDYRLIGDVDLVDPRGQGPTVSFQQMDAPRPQRNRIHIDVFVPHDVAEARVAAALAAGGHVAADHSPEYWTLADPEGNEVDVAPWPDQD
jgi:4a-hydroxytetrahydrobiopterin dehydratase